MLTLVAPDWSLHCYLTFHLESFLFIYLINYLFVCLFVSFLFLLNGRFPVLSLPLRTAVPLAEANFSPVFTGTAA